ncbi:MAG: RNA 3'-terminal phosphate cyclase [Nitrospirota bacterium]|nr:RNA 3'-terminal phosphate cyclase [Nitrospirota bacterium]
MLTIDGSSYSGSGAIVRQAVAFSALTGIPIHLVRARAKRSKPGLRRQHVRVVEAIRELINGKTEGACEGSQEIHFEPGPSVKQEAYRWDIGSAGSTTMLALGVLPVLAFKATPTVIEIHGGLFQDFAPSVFHLQHVILPLLNKMGLKSTLTMERPGYVPTGNGSLSLRVQPVCKTLRPLRLDSQGPVQRIWGIALASHLAERRVSHRMADTVTQRLSQAGYESDIERMEDSTAQQAGAALAVFADCSGEVRLGADRAGAPRRRSEAIGHHVANHLLSDLSTGATVDRFAADQIIPFAALAKGESRFIIPQVTEHVQTSAWLANLFVGAKVHIENQTLTIQGSAFVP